jgi:hypothetical protein
MYLGNERCGWNPAMPVKTIRGHVYINFVVSEGSQPQSKKSKTFHGSKISNTDSDEDCKSAI